MANKLEKYHGIIPAFYACFDDLGEISPSRTQALARHYLSQGVQGLYVNGSSGECIYLSVAERKTVLENVLEAVGGKMLIIAHVAANSTRDSMELARHAEQLGVDAIASIPPIYFRLPEHAIAKYWNDISSAAPHTDFIIYNIPQLAGTALTLPLLREMMKNPRVVGVKNSSMPVQDIQMFVDAGEGKLAVFNGPDEQFIAGRMMGACGGIGGTYGVMPGLFLKANELFIARKLDEALSLQNDICRIIYAMCACHGSMYAVIKELLRRKGLNCGSVRPPFPALIPEDMKQVDVCEKMIKKAERTYLGH
ncbi:MAG: N-acetylneuraminate lyase [Clostridiales bacterium]|nr:N-acetylneuraminate lyase [Clostridiales bacterium]